MLYELISSLTKTALTQLAFPTHHAMRMHELGGAYAEFRASVEQLDEINWTAVAATDFRDPDVKEGKQAEFLMQGFFRWSLIQHIGVHSTPMQSRVLRSRAGASHRPPVEVIPDWYY